MAVTKRIRYEILRRDDNTCRYCGRKAPDVALTIDHVQPVALGGSDDPSNLVAACADCNAGKTSTSPDSPLLEQVQDDAIRWAAAMHRAAEDALRQRDALVQHRDAFAAKWNSWGINGTSLELPGDWGFSVDRWLSLGLPLPLLLDCVDIAMGNRKLAHTSIWTYMAGVAWTKLRKIQDAAQTDYANPRADPDETGHEHQTDRNGRRECSTCWRDGYDSGGHDAHWRAQFTGGTREDAYQRGYEDGCTTTRAAMEAATRPSSSPEPIAQTLDTMAALFRPEESDGS